MAKTAREKARTAGEIIEDNREALTYLALIVGAFYFFNKAFKSVVEALKNPTKKQEEEYTNAIQEDKSKAEKQGQKLSYKPAQYETWANTLEDAMKGPGTDEKLIYKTIAFCRNDLDLLTLIDAYGIRPLNVWGTRGNLGQALRDDLDSSEMNTVNKVLEIRGIKYRF